MRFYRSEKGELTKGMKYYEYYREAYGAVRDGMVGEYDVETVSETGEKSQEKKYGLKAYFPIAKGFEYTIMMISAPAEAMDISESIWDMI